MINIYTYIKKILNFEVISLQFYLSFKLIMILFQTINQIAYYLSIKMEDTQ